MSKLPESDGERQKGNLQQQNTVCNNGPKGWYRFEGAAGTRMPTSCSPTHRCNSHLPGWLSGAHPTQADGQVTRTVFFHWHSDCCYKSITVKVICYIYYINGTSWCHLRFWNRLNRCWSEKLWILCNRFKNWLHLCVLYFSTLTDSKRFVIGHD